MSSVSLSHSCNGCGFLEVEDLLRLWQVAVTLYFSDSCISACELCGSM